MTTRVVFWLPAINPYWNERFNALARDGEVSFSCWFNRTIDPMRSWVVDPATMTYDHEFLPAGTRRRLRRTAQLYAGARPTHLFTFHFDPGLWPAWLHRIRGRHLSLYCLMTWDSWVDRSWPKELAKRLFFSSASSVLTPGPDSDTYVRRYGARDIHRLHHAVDADRLALAARGRQESDGVRLLVLGRMTADKGVDFLIEVLDEVLGNSGNATVRFVGDGPLHDTLVQWATGWPGRARIDGFVQAADVPDVLADCDVLLFPTTGDPYGLVVDEALAAGLAVVSSDRAGDITWRLEEGRGWVLPLGDRRAWVNTVLGLCDNPGDVRRASAAALAFSAGHDVDRWVREIKEWLASTTR